METTKLNYQNDLEPRVFDYIPSDCYECLSYRDIIITQLNDIPMNSFEKFHFGPFDTYLLLNGQLKLTLKSFAFNNFIINKPNHTMFITMSAPNSWLNITNETFNGLDIRSYSTLKLIIKYFYGITFYSQSLNGIKMGKQSKLIIEISSVTQVHFLSNIFGNKSNLSSHNSSYEIHILRTDTILFNENSFSSIQLYDYQKLIINLELISLIHLKKYSFSNLILNSYSLFKINSIFINRFTIDSYAFSDIILDRHSKYNLTIKILGTCICLTSYSFSNLILKPFSIFYTGFNNVRGISLFSYSFFNLQLNINSKLIIESNNPVNDPNPIINIASNTFMNNIGTTLLKNEGTINFNFNYVTLNRYDIDSLQMNFIYIIKLKDIGLLDLSNLTTTVYQIKKLTILFNGVRYVKWPLEQISLTKKLTSHSLNSEQVDTNKLQYHHEFPPNERSIQFYFNYVSNQSCILYDAPSDIPWYFLSNSSCNCPLLFAYKHGKLDGQTIDCIRKQSGKESVLAMNECKFDRVKELCTDIFELFSQATKYYNSDDQNNSAIVQQPLSRWEYSKTWQTRQKWMDKDLSDTYLNPIVLRQLVDINYLKCNINFSYTSSIIIRTRLGNLGLVIGIIIGVFVLLLIIVMALLNGVQYKMREYDPEWTYRRNMSWTSLRRTLSQTSLRRSRRDLRINGTIINESGTDDRRISRSDNQLDCLQYHNDEQSQPFEIQNCQRSHRNKTVKNEIVDDDETEVTCEPLDIDTKRTSKR
ncbi:unnamed protein product [Didymodactylos carnosus]|uniref:Uncharacterized protein n=1 Tax=Didymodactylos carnosus TaxID=1234261 RepID=A0A814L7V3_9BILA|nr:unnamed protein product [Didymodactylos carnosus]CAF1059751.1 unnamed protein product [Didymodactylos carnosus]CAF3639358.1 unnamed protein product [Didymodactylos carnosus]CAF3828245.1 unnamed protein product [Didymodactylos carnosus]